MNKDDFKKKITAAINHVKAHPVPYTILATATVCAVGELVYLHKHTLVDLDKAAKSMEKSGMGLWFGHKENGKVIIMKLTHIDNLVRD